MRPLRWLSVLPLPSRSPRDPATTTDLGVDAVWLMPVFRSPSSNADFEQFLAEAHRRGIRGGTGRVFDRYFSASRATPTTPR